MKLIVRIALGLILAGSVYAGTNYEYVGERNSFNRFHGQGTYTSPQGVYVGSWVDGRKSGQGTMTWTNGDKYVGNWEDNKEQGQGVKTFANGDRYEGSFAAGKIQGKGSLKYANGAHYEGDFAADLPNGKGTLTTANGDKFVGQFVKGEKSDGTLTLSNGDKISGKWSGNQVAGEGIYIFAEGEEYSGKIAGMKPEGKGNCKVKGKAEPCEFAEGKKVVKVVPPPPPPPPAPPAPPKPAVVAKPVPPPVVKPESRKVEPPKPEPPKVVFSETPEFSYDHDWHARGNYNKPNTGSWQKDINKIGELIISATDEDLVISLRVNEYKGPGTYSLAFFDATTSRKGLVSYASSADQPGTITILHDDGTIIAGTFSFKAFRNGDASSSDSRSVTNGHFTVTVKK